MLLITLTTMLFSGAGLIQIGLSYTTPIQFSYTLYQVTPPKEIEEHDLEKCTEGSEVVEIEGDEYCWDENTRREGLINTLSIFLSMLFLYILHRWGLEQTKKIKTPEWLIKGYTFISLLIYSVTGVIAIPTAIYMTVNYLVTKVGTYSTQYAPAYTLGLVVLTLPLWYVFFKATKELKD